MSTQNELSEEGLNPSAEDILMFLGYCLRAYEITNEEPLAIDNELVKELINESMANDTVPTIVVGTKGEAAILQARMESADGIE